MGILDLVIETRGGAGVRHGWFFDALTNILPIELFTAMLTDGAKLHFIKNVSL